MCDIALLSPVCVCELCFRFSFPLSLHSREFESLRFSVLSGERSVCKDLRGDFESRVCGLDVHWCGVCSAAAPSSTTLGFQGGRQLPSVFIFHDTDFSSFEASC